MDEFYITLPSNVTSEYFENTSANYKTKLFKNLNMKDYVVGLAEVSYTFRWNNLINNEYILITYLVGFRLERKIFKLRKGHYTIEELVHTLNSIIIFEDKNFPKPLFKIISQKHIRKIQIQLKYLNNSLVIPIFSENLSNILGIDFDKYRNLAQDYFYYKLSPIPEPLPEENWVQEKIDKYDADQSFDIKAGFHTIYIYCDIIKHQFVGDGKSQLLRYIEVPNEAVYGNQNHLKFPNIHYLPLITDEINSIQINFQDDTGMDIPFNYARNFVVLHFRKR